MSTLGLIALGLAAVFAVVVMTAFPDVRVTVVRMAMGTFLLLLGVTLVVLLLIAITGFDPSPLIRQGAVIQTGHKVVDFFTLLPDQYKVTNVEYKDTDGDKEKEWVVFYQFDTVDGRNPYAAAVYDFDRGEPPVVFPYRLLPPDRDYLSEAAIRLELEDIVELGETAPIPELMIFGDAGGLDTDLTIFRHTPNSLPWEFPRDEPRRYQVIGSFRGDGGITFDADSKMVTVRNRAGYDRSQLAVEAVYALDEARGSYMSPISPELTGAPISSRVVFAFGMPPEILDTPFPEKVVLGFYETVAKKQPTIDPSEFLTGQALIEYNRGNLAYFGFAGTNKASDVSNVRITQLSYAPDVEEFDPSITVLGQDPRLLTVQVGFEAQVGATHTRTPEPIEWITTLVNGKWKMDRRP